MHQRRLLVEAKHSGLSVRRQCELLGLNRSTYYYEPVPESALNLALMRLIDEQYMQTPFYGWRRMTHCLQQMGHQVNHKRVQRLMCQMGLQAVGPKKSLSKHHPEHRIYPYLLRNVTITRVNQVWSADITYIPMQNGFLYLAAVIDWYSRYILAWQLSNTLEGGFCVDVLQQALQKGRPHIFNTDQGAQFTAPAFTAILDNADIAISMDGKGRALDNIFIERFWRTLKYEDVYLKRYESGAALFGGLDHYITFYNHVRPHQSLGYIPPAAVFNQLVGAAA